jgi:hypothetical protein
MTGMQERVGRPSEDAAIWIAQTDERGGRRHPLDVLAAQFAADVAGQPPLCDEEEFTAILDGIVADFAPRQFAIAVVYGERFDGEIVAWGMCFEEGAVIASTDRRHLMRVPSPEHALKRFRFGNHITPRIVWLNPGAATPAGHGEAA